MIYDDKNVLKFYFLNVYEISFKVKICKILKYFLIQYIIIVKYEPYLIRNLRKLAIKESLWQIT